MSFKSPFMGKGENMQEIISKLNEFLEGGSVSMSALARALGISPGAISQFRAGKYKGDNAAIAAKIGAYIDASAKKAKEFATSPARDEIFNSRDYKMANFVISEAVGEREIALLYGTAGSGKSTILRDFAAKNPNAVLIEATCHTNANALLGELCEALKLEAAGSANAKLKAISSFLKTADKVLLIDEAEHLPLRALEDLRRIYDFSSTPLILAGTEILLKNLVGRNKELRQLYSRICGKWAMQGLSKEESDAFYGAGIFAHAKGNFRASEKLHKKSVRLAALNGCAVGEEIIAQACGMVIL